MLAAKECFTRLGVGTTTIEDVARASGLSRATIYRYVPGGRDEIVVSVFIAEASDWLENLGDRLVDYPDLASQLEAAIPEVIRWLNSSGRMSELFRAMVTPGHLNDLSLAPLLQVTEEFIGPYLGQARAARILRTDLSDGEVADWLLHVILSIASFDFPTTRTSDQISAYVRRFVLPSLLEPAALRRRNVRLEPKALTGPA